jgi:hypothetical protein
LAVSFIEVDADIVVVPRKSKGSHGAHGGRQSHGGARRFF